jgi:hypothetical protein
VSFTGGSPPFARPTKMRSSDARTSGDGSVTAAIRSSIACSSFEHAPSAYAMKYALR